MLACDSGSFLWFSLAGAFAATFALNVFCCFRSIVSCAPCDLPLFSSRPSFELLPFLANPLAGAEQAACSQHEYATTQSSRAGLIDSKRSFRRLPLCPVCCTRELHCRTTVTAIYLACPATLSTPVLA